MEIFLARLSVIVKSLYATAPHHILLYSVAFNTCATQKTPVSNTKLLHGELIYLLLRRKKYLIMYQNIWISRYWPIKYTGMDPWWRAYMPMNQVIIRFRNGLVFDGTQPFPITVTP